MLMIAIVFIAITGIDKSKLKGKIGEARTTALIHKHLDSDSYTLIENITIPGKGGTTQIDHVVVSPFGIFVIEVKNMPGWIFGGKNQKRWTQKFPQKSFPFQNPLRQNYRHLKTLSSVLALHEDKLHSVICFVGDCELKTRMPANVLKANQLTPYIHSFSNVLLDQENISKVFRKIDKARLQPSNATDRKHLESLKTRHTNVH